MRVRMCMHNMRTQSGTLANASPVGRVGPVGPVGIERLKATRTRQWRSTVQCSDNSGSGSSGNGSGSRSNGRTGSRRLALAAGAVVATQFRPLDAVALDTFIDTGGTCIRPSRTGECSGAVSEVLERVSWPEAWPFDEADYGRYDEQTDDVFYESPRFVRHIDDAAIAALTSWYAENLPASNSGAAVLDLCSSWISHYPEGYSNARIAGLGMNEEELARNTQLTDYIVRDLNEFPFLPYEDNTFDFVTNAVSVDYLTRPLEVFKEMVRVLKPGGVAAMSFSNRYFPTKAVAVWTGASDLEHVWIAGSYFHFAGGFASPVAEDITPIMDSSNGGGIGGLFSGQPRGTDPMYVVYAKKLPE